MCESDLVVYQRQSGLTERRAGVGRDARLLLEVSRGWLASAELSKLTPSHYPTASRVVTTILLRRTISV